MKLLYALCICPAYGVEEEAVEGPADVWEDVWDLPRVRLQLQQEHQLEEVEDQAWQMEINKKTWEGIYQT